MGFCETTKTFTLQAPCSTTDNGGKKFGRFRIVGRPDTHVQYAMYSINNERQTDGIIDRRVLYR